MARFLAYVVGVWQIIMKINQLAYFTESVNTLIESQLILVDKNIASVLQCVATSSILRRNLSDTVKNMSYATEFSRARVTWTLGNGELKSQLKLPTDRDRLFAFVVCLLTEVDCGRRNLLDFLKEYYNAETNEASYALFAAQVLKPFKQAGESILASIDPDSLNAENVQQARRFFDAETIYIETATAENIFDLMNKIRLTLTAWGLSAAETTELNAVSEYLVNALYLKNPKVLAVSYLAYKNTVLKYPQVADYLDGIMQLMQTISM